MYEDFEDNIYIYVYINALTLIFLILQFAEQNIIKMIAKSFLKQKGTMMPIDKGKKPGRPDKYTPNTKQNSQVPAALKKVGVPNTPENRDRVHRAIGGRELNFNQLVAEVKAIFGK